MSRLPSSVEAAYDLWKRERRSGCLELHFSNGRIRKIKHGHEEVVEQEKDPPQLPFAD